MKFRQHGAFAAAAAAAVLIAEGCSGDDADISSACDRYAETLCTAGAACTPGAEQYFGDPGSCVERYSLSCEAVMALDDVATTAEDLDACSEAIEATGCEDQLASLFDVCLPLFSGTRPDGERCRNGLQCEGGRCDMGNELGCGVCATLPGAGDTCEGGACAYGLLCADGTCTEVTYANEGESCAAAGTLCQANLTCRDDVCVALLAEGESCDGSVPCQFHLECDETSGTCVAGPPDAMVGQACGSDPDTGSYVSCVANAYCDDGTCKAKVSDGGSCTSSSECKIAAVCYDGICTLGPPTCE